MDKNLKIALVLTATDKASRVLGAAFTKMEKGAKTLSHTGKEFGEIGDKAMIAGGAITAFFGETVNLARESDIASRRLGQVFKSMGDKTGEAAKQAEEFAEKLQFKIGFDHTEIEATQAKLATFKYLTTESAQKINAFNRSTALSFDLQAAGFGEATQNAVILGKALNNPALGATALKRIGAMNAEDIPLVKQIQATKGIVAAQEFVLRAVEKQVKGVAAATADPMKKMNVSLKHAGEAIGKDLLPELSKLIEKFNASLPKIMNFIETHKGLIKFVAKAGVALLTFGIAMKGVGFIMNAFATGFKIFGAIMKIGQAFSAVASILAANPIILIIAGIAIAALLIYKYWDQISAWFTDLWNGVCDVFSKAWEWIKNMFLDYTPWGLIIKHWDKISGLFSKIWGGVKTVFKATWEWVKNMFLNYTPEGLIIKHWDKISNFFKGLWDNVKGVFTDAYNWVMGLGEKFYNAGKNIATSIWNGIKSAAMLPVDAIKSMVTNVRAYLPFSPAKVGPLKDIHRIKLMETIAATITAKPLIRAMDGAIGGLAGHSTQIANRSSNTSQIHFAPVINLHGSASAADAHNITAAMKAEFAKMMREHDNRKSRVAY